MQPRREKTERSDHRKIDVIFDRHKLQRRILIESRNPALISRIDLFDLRVFVDNFRFVIAQLFDLVGDLLEICLPNDHTN